MAFATPQPGHSYWVHNYFMFYHFYVLVYSLKDGKFYIGFTHDLGQRLKEHNSGDNTSTKYRRSLKLIYYEAYLLKQDTEARERYLKTSMGKRVIKKQLRHFFYRAKTNFKQ